MGPWAHAIVRSHVRRRQDVRHRAARVARARGGRGPARGDRAAHAGHRAPARSEPAHARLSQGQGAAAGGDPAHRARERPRRDGARRDGPLVPRRDRRRRHPSRRRPRARRRRPPRRGPAADLHDRDRRAARRRRSASTRASRWASASRPPTTRRSTPSSRPCASAARAWRPRRMPPPARATSWSWTTSARSTARTSPAARAATSSSSWAPGASCPASRTSSWARRPATSARSRSASPTTTAPTELAGKEAEFAVTVKEIKRKDLPALDDDFASDAAGFDTLAELREDIMAKLREADESRVEAEFREAVLDAVVKDSQVEVPAALVDARAQELWERMLHSLSHQGISKEAYLRIAGREEAGDPRGGQARRRAGAAPRGRDRRRRRGRGHRGHRGRRPRRAADDRRARAARRPRSCAPASRRPAAWTTCARTSPSAPRSTCWPRARLQYPSSRPRRVTSCGHRADKAATTRPSRLWTPGARD